MILHMTICKSCDGPTGEVSTTKEIGICDECVAKVLNSIRELTETMQADGNDRRTIIIEDLEDGEAEIDGMWHPLEEE